MCARRVSIRGGNWNNGVSGAGFGASNGNGWGFGNTNSNNGGGRVASRNTKKAKREILYRSVKDRVSAEKT